MQTHNTDSPFFIHIYVLSTISLFFLVSTLKWPIYPGQDFSSKIFISAKKMFYLGISSQARCQFQQQTFVLPENVSKTDYYFQVFWQLCSMGSRFSQLSFHLLLLLLCNFFQISQKHFRDPSSSLEKNHIWTFVLIG